MRRPQEKAGAPPSGLTTGLAPSEKRRLAVMIGGLVVVVGILISTLAQVKNQSARQAPHALLDESVQSAVPVALPELDVARLETLVHDREPVERVVLESEGADLLLAVARRYTPRHFAVADTPELDAARCAALAKDPASARGKPFTARGRIVALRPRSGADREEQWIGRLELEDGSTAYFLALEVPEHAAEIGGFVRVDGLFLKLYSSEDEAAIGSWPSGPLLVGARAETSYPALGKVTALDLDLFAEVEDADLAPGEGSEPKLVRTTPVEPFWQLMAFARDLAPDAIDWSKAPLLDQRLLDQLLKQPASWRAQPVRIPISRLQDGRVLLAGENPARMQRYTQGWIGNTTWKGVIQFRAPVLRPELAIGDLVQGRGFFLHDFAYESSERGLRVAPIFVLQSLERHVPEKSRVLEGIPWVMGGIGAFLVVLFVVVAQRDRRKSLDFYGELARRRRARRAPSKDGLSAGSAVP